MISIIDLALKLLQIALDAAKVGGVAPGLVTDLEAAVAAVAKVHGTPVSYQQLEGLRVKAQW